MTDCPPQMIKSGKKGCYLNKLTLSELLFECGKFPWEIIRVLSHYEDMTPPTFAFQSKITYVDLIRHDIRILVKKDENEEMEAKFKEWNVLKNEELSFYDYMDKLKYENELLKKQVADLLNSTSWRTTKPLREFKRLLSRMI